MKSMKAFMQRNKIKSKRGSKASRATLLARIRECIARGQPAGGWVSASSAEVSGSVRESEVDSDDSDGKSEEENDDEHSEHSDGDEAEEHDADVVSSESDHQSIEMRPQRIRRKVSHGAVVRSDDLDFYESAE
jgi:hypothetical protein